jgi:hypothetical protein
MIGGVLILGLVGMLGWQGKLSNTERSPSNDPFFWSAALEAQTDCKSIIGLKNAHYCVQTEGHTLPTVAILGDSHANRHFYAFAKAYSNSSESLIQIGRPGCLPLIGVDTIQSGTSNKCHPTGNELIEYAVGTSSIQTVILAFRGPLYVNGTGFGWLESDVLVRLTTDQNRSTNALTNEAIYSASLEKTLAALLAAGKRVVFLYDNPELDFDPKSCARLAHFSLPIAIATECAVSLVVHEQRRKKYVDVTEAVLHRFPSVVAIDLSKRFCDAIACRAVVDGVILYRDNDHLNMQGAEYAGEWLRDILISSGLIPSPYSSQLAPGKILTRIGNPLAYR